MLLLSCSRRGGGVCCAGLQRERVGVWAWSERPQVTHDAAATLPGQAPTQVQRPLRPAMTSGRSPRPMPSTTTAALATRDDSALRPATPTNPVAIDSRRPHRYLRALAFCSEHCPGRWHLAAPRASLGRRSECRRNRNNGSGQAMRREGDGHPHPSVLLSPSSCCSSSCHSRSRPQSAIPQSRQSPNPTSRRYRSSIIGREWRHTPARIMRPRPRPRSRLSEHSNGAAPIQFVPLLAAARWERRPGLSASCTPPRRALFVCCRRAPVGQTPSERDTSNASPSCVCSVLPHCLSPVPSSSNPPILQHPNATGELRAGGVRQWAMPRPPDRITRQWPWTSVVVG